MIDMIEEYGKCKVNTKMYKSKFMFDNEFINHCDHDEDDHGNDSNKK